MKQLLSTFALVLLVLFTLVPTQLFAEERLSGGTYSFYCYNNVSFELDSVINKPAYFYYDLSGTEAIVTRKTGRYSPSNDFWYAPYVEYYDSYSPYMAYSYISIPSTITYRGLSFTVTAIDNRCFAPVDIDKYGNTNGNNTATHFANFLSVELPNTVTIIGDYAFYNCVNLQKITLPNALQEVGNYAFSGCASLDSITLPNTLQKVGDYAFSNCSYLRSITLSNTLQKIGEGTFSGCGLVSITIPQSMNQMSTSCFDGCNLLRTIIYTGKTAPSGWTATTNTYVPDLQAYSSPKVTMNHYNVKEMISFTDNVFDYTGQAPTTTWNNNVEGYTASLTMPTLKKDVGSYVEYIPVTFTNGSDSFSTEVAYRYTIKAHELTVKVDDASRVYGEDNPTFNIIYSGFVYGEDENVFTTRPTVTTTATTLSNVGTYPISINGGVAKNYILKYEDGILTITKAGLEVSVNDTTKVYGSENPTFKLNFSGLKNNETKPNWVKFPTFSTTAEKNSNVGNYKVTVDCSATNYNITKNNSGTLAIKPAQLTIKAKDAYKNYYEENPTFTYVCTGFVNGDNESSVLKVKPTFSTTANQYSNAGIYDIMVKDASLKNNNYDIVYASGTFIINKRPLVAKVGNYERCYGEDNPPFTIEYEGFVGNDSESCISIKPTVKTAATSTSNVGSYPINISGGETTNYDFSYTSGMLTIGKAEQTIEWNQDLSNVEVGSQVELAAISSSGLPIEYTMQPNNSASLYKVGAKTYIDCIASGRVLLRASQNGNVNYYESPKVANSMYIVGNTASDPTLTIIQSEKGLIKTQVAKGSVYTFTIEATEGWKVHSVSFNDKDITEQLDDNKSFTTPNINASTTLNVVYESLSDGINSAKFSAAKILGTSFGIRVENAHPNDVLKIYTTDGKLIKKLKIQSSEVNVNLPNNEIYIVNLENLSVKVRL